MQPPTQMIIIQNYVLEIRNKNLEDSWCIWRDAAYQ